MAGYESITTVPCPRTAVPAARARAGGDVQAWLPTTGGPLDYADGGIGCREPGDSFAGKGAARRCPRRSSSMSRTLPASPGHTRRVTGFVALGHVGG